ncbi:MAG: radical SAM protein, partial [Paludibacteraceae bacterium]|nr:radical SAM protein [Paludibacteraceae bacterium]
TFSGNGEPTLHPNFLEIVQVTRTLRDRYFPNAKISLLSNATKIDTKKDAIMLCDNRILKLDSAVDATLQLIDRPVEHDLTADKIIEKLQMFEGDFVLQTCFLRGEYQGKQFDNTTPNELQAWYEAVKKTNPKQIMVYAIDRQTPVKTIEKLTFEEIQSLVLPLQEQGFDVQIFA